MLILDDIGHKLRDALGLPPNVTWFELTISVGEPLLMRYGCKDNNIREHEVLHEHEIIKKPNLPIEITIKNDMACFSLMDSFIGEKLITALGLPPNISFLSLSGDDAGKPLQISVGYCPQEINQEAVVEALSEYDIVKKLKPKDEKDIDEVEKMKAYQSLVLRKAEIPMPENENG